jgi:hypothetical protein
LEPGEVRVSVIDLTGRVLVDKMYRTDSNINELIRIQEHTAGIFCLRLINVRGVTYRKIVVE